MGGTEKGMRFSQVTNVLFRVLRQIFMSIVDRKVRYRTYSTARHSTAHQNDWPAYTKTPLREALLF